LNDSVVFHPKPLSPGPPSILQGPIQTLLETGLRQLLPLMESWGRLDPIKSNPIVLQNFYQK